jgi:tropomyosin
LELEVEQHARKAKQLEDEKHVLEKKLDEMVAKYNVVKQELDSTLKGLEDL